MLRKSLFILAGLFLLGLVGWNLGPGMREHRQQGASPKLGYGLVTEVNMSNWNYEVEMAKSRQPVLVYFYSYSSNPAQRQIVESFAMSNAGRVKVVAVNCDRADGAMLARRYGVLSYPSFAAFYRFRQARGIDGIFSTSSELQRLINSVNLP